MRSAGRLLVSDIDGTVLKYGETRCSKPVEQAFIAASEVAITCLATARPLDNKVAHFAKDLHLSGYIVTTNGAMISDAKTLEPVEKLGIPSQYLTDLMAFTDSISVVRVFVGNFESETLYQQTSITATDGVSHIFLMVLEKETSNNSKLDIPNTLRIAHQLANLTGNFTDFFPSK